ncbi:E3 ubiquitin-protein ligase RBBP6-like [Nyctibius grandis]|uniref:E3 ubiquitin-protein ligase RBBP6-like n=1 Tax=Nyctibius grandis TaxID=48427 RepID=UPI0035BBA0CC
MARSVKVTPGTSNAFGSQRGNLSVAGIDAVAEQVLPALTMSCIHYKFFSKLNYGTVTFNGPHICLGDLKRQIMAHEKLKAANCDLQITNAQTKEEYTDDNALIPKNLSVIVRRIPPGGVKATSKTYAGKDSYALQHLITFISSSRSRTETASGTSKVIDDSSASISLAQLTKTANLAEANASEEEKIKAMMIQSCRAYDPINYMKNPSGPPPTSYICGRPGHYIKKRPTNGVKNFEPVPRVKKSTGIPKSFLMEVKDPKTKGAMLTNTGKYVIPIINAEAYARGKKQQPHFLPEEPSFSSAIDDSVPDVLLCLICKELMTDAAIIPCCGNSYCDECIRTALLESEEHTCPTCHQTDVSPDALIANKFLRQAVNDFRNGTGHTKRLHKQIQQQLPPPPPPAPLMTVTPPAALVTAAELPKSSSLAISSFLQEKVDDLISLVAQLKQEVERLYFAAIARTATPAPRTPPGAKAPAGSRAQPPRERSPARPAPGTPPTGGSSRGPFPPTTPCGQRDPPAPPEPPRAAAAARPAPAAAEPARPQHRAAESRTGLPLLLPARTRARP